MLIDAEYYVTLDGFDLENVLLTGAKLLSADTEKYEIKEDINGIL